MVINSNYILLSPLFNRINYSVVGKFPGTIDYSFAIACNIAGFDVEKENSVRIKFVSSDEQLLNDTGDIKFQLPVDQMKADKPSVMQFNLDMRNLVFHEVGIYSTKVFVNGEQIGEYKIQVIVGDRE